MAASAWQLYNEAKKYIGNGTITLGAGVFKMVLAKAASNASTFTLSAYSEITNEIAGSAGTNGYIQGGRNLVPATAQWTVGASAKQMKFTMSSIGLAFTASGASIANIKFAVLRNSSGSTTTGKLLCWCKLSSSQFTVTSPNTLTVLPAATGIFTLT